MKKSVFIVLVSFLLFSCGSSFNSFYNTHKTDIGTTAFQVPQFMRAVLSSLSPEAKTIVSGITDFKYIKFENMQSFKRSLLINEMNAITKSGYTDVFRKNEVDNTRIISVKEKGIVVTNAIIFNSNQKETTAYYLEGRFNPAQIKAFEDEEVFNSFSNQLIDAYQINLSTKPTPTFNPN
ncbi:DUF4252 domain-containing protein [Lacinutrix salivirga]